MPWLFLLFFTQMITVASADRLISPICERITAVLEQAHREGNLALADLEQFAQAPYLEKVSSIFTSGRSKNLLAMHVAGQTLSILEKAHEKSGSPEDLRSALDALILKIRRDQEDKKTAFSVTEDNGGLNRENIHEVLVEPVEIRIYSEVNNGAFFSPPMKLANPIMVADLPITQRQWLEVMGERYMDDFDDNWNGDAVPVEPDLLSAMEFMNRLSKKHGLKPVYPEELFKSADHRSWLSQVAVDKFYPYSDLIDAPNADIYQTEGYRLPTSFEAMLLYEHARRYLNRVNNLEDKDFKDVNKANQLLAYTYETLSRSRELPDPLMRLPIFLGPKSPVFGLVGPGQFYVHHVDVRWNERALAPFFKLLLDEATLDFEKIRLQRESSRDMDVLVSNSYFRQAKLPGRERNFSLYETNSKQILNGQTTTSMTKEYLRERARAEYPLPEQDILVINPQSDPETFQSLTQDHASQGRTFAYGVSCLKHWTHCTPIYYHSAFSKNPGISFNGVNHLATDYWKIHLRVVRNVK